VYSGEGRTVTINGEVMSPPDTDWPGDPPYLVEFSAGINFYTSWSYY
jgi:hypothetical protein